MEMRTGSGRSLGVLLFIQLTGLSLPFILLMPIVTSDFLVSAAPISGRIRVAAFLLLANALLTAWIGLKLFMDLPRRIKLTAVWLLVIAGAWLVLQTVDNAHILSMLSLSEQNYNHPLEPGMADAAAVLKITRRHIHYSELFVIDLWFAFFYGILFALRMIPRAISMFGLIAVAVHAAAITFPVLIGYPSIQPLGVSLAVSHIAVAGWLVARGFSKPSKAFP